MTEGKSSAQAPQQPAAARGTQGAIQAGRIRIRRRAAEYRAASTRQSTQTRKAIDSAVKAGQQLRASIEKRIDAGKGRQRRGGARSRRTS